MAQRRRGLLLRTHTPPPQARGLLLARRPPGRHQPISRRTQQKPQTIYLDRRPKSRSRRRRAREASVGVTPLVGDSDGDAFAPSHQGGLA